MGKRKAPRKHVGDGVVLATFGEGGANGWDLWVPKACTVLYVKQQGGGTLIRLVPKEV
jgi:hypothetical protein